MTLPSMPQAMQSWELRVPMGVHRDELVAAITWRVGPSEVDFDLRYYTIGDGVVLSQVEPPEGSPERPIPGFRRSLDEE